MQEYYYVDVVHCKRCCCIPSTFTLASPIFQGLTQSLRIFKIPLNSKDLANPLPQEARKHAPGAMISGEKETNQSTSEAPQGIFRWKGLVNQLLIYHLPILHYPQPDHHWSKCGVAKALALYAEYNHRRQRLPNHKSMLRSRPFPIMLDF